MTVKVGERSARLPVTEVHRRHGRPEIFFRPRLLVVTRPGASEREASEARNSAVARRGGSEASRGAHSLCESVRAPSDGAPEPRERLSK